MEAAGIFKKGKLTSGREKGIISRGENGQVTLLMG
jgi:hypothetical protein